MALTREDLRVAHTHVGRHITGYIRLDEQAKQVVPPHVMLFHDASTIRAEFGKYGGFLVLNKLRTNAFYDP